MSRVFVSHSHADNMFSRRFVNALRSQGADVWYDEHRLGSGAIRAVIDKELAACDTFVVILSPDANTSDWVNAEIDAALFLLRGKKMKVFLPIVAVPCEVSLLLEGYKRIEGFSPEEAANRAYRTLFGSAAEAASAQAEVDSKTQQTIDLNHRIVPPSLRPRGYVAMYVNNVEVIVAPMITVTAGPFTLGSNRLVDTQADADETPQHSLTLPAYDIGKYPLTVAEYACYLRATGDVMPPGWSEQALDHPVVNINWNNAIVYTQWLSNLTGRPYGLSSEAEWEKAARGFDGRLYPWGNSQPNAYTNTWANVDRLTRGLWSLMVSSVKTKPVGTYEQGVSPCGCYDMCRNVLEWTRSQYQPYPYVPDDGRESLDARGPRVLRGGFWFSGNQTSRVAARFASDTSTIHTGFGARLSCPRS